MWESKQENRDVQTYLMTQSHSHCWKSKSCLPCISYTRPLHLKTRGLWPVWQCGPLKETRGIQKPEHFNIFFTSKSVFFPWSSGSQQSYGCVCHVISAANQSLHSLYWVPVEGYTWEAAEKTWTDAALNQHLLSFLLSSVWLLGTWSHSCV